MPKKILYPLFLSFALFFSGGVSAYSKKKEISEVEKLWKRLPIQHQGRIKPFDTFSREILRTVYGKESYKSRSAVEALLSWLLIPDFWNNEELILIEGKELKKGLDLPLKQKRFRPSDLRRNRKFALQLVELKSLKQRKEPLDSYFQSLEKLETGLLLYTLVQTGFLIRLEPDPKSASWRSLSEMTKPAANQFQKLISIYVRLISEHVFSFFPDSSSMESYVSLGKEQSLNVGKSVSPVKEQSLNVGKSVSPVKEQSLDAENSLSPGKGKSLNVGKSVSPGKEQSLDVGNSLSSAKEKSSDAENPLSLEKGKSLDAGNSLRLAKEQSSDGFDKKSLGASSLAKQTKNVEIEKESLKEKKRISLSHFKKEMEAFQSLLFKNRSFQKSKINTEVFYNGFQPFQKAWILYFLFLMALSILFILKKLSLMKWIIPLAVLGFASHSLGMILRSYIMSRPPVSNMYETVVWVPWAAVLAGCVFYFKGIKAPFAASIILSAFCLLLTSLAPDILDGSLQPLEAVLNSSFWLTTHVLTITMSYSFFFLAFVLGDMALLSYLFDRLSSMNGVKKMQPPIYRSIQWGVVFLAGGTILGGIWADYSWGRFWGWDPKESWALVSLLAYLALLHGRLAGWIKPFGMAIGSVIMFFFVIMAWYGVNFVLGAGLHSYGFGSGGVEYVMLFVVLHLILCALAFLKYKGLYFVKIN